MVTLPSECVKMNVTEILWLSRALAIDDSREEAEP